MMERALAMMIHEKGPLVLKAEHYEFLIENNYGDLLRTVGDGILIATLPPSSQLDVRYLYWQLGLFEYLIYLIISFTFRIVDRFRSRC
jgi:hypothetical protein